VNRSPEDMPAGIPVALYGRWSDGDRLVATAVTSDEIAAGWTGEAPSSESCEVTDPGAYEAGLTDVCEYEIGGFTPVEIWQGGTGRHSMAAPAVADLDGDGMPEIIANLAGLFLGSGDLVAMRGDNGLDLWSATDAEMGYGSSPAVADVDGDGDPEIAFVRQYAGSLFAVGDYTVALYDHEGFQVWESEHFVAEDFDYATAISISDMDHDGSPEIIAGRVILNADGTTRGVGAYGRGSYGVVSVPGVDWVISESSVSAVADMNLDGVEEVVVGNAFYNPDGNIVNADPTADDGMIAIANLDDDEYGEFVAATYNTVRAVDTDFSLLWGPLTIKSANIVSPPAVGDIDGDGYPEIIVAGGSELYALNHDGTELWSARVTDESGASGASIFDFEADGMPEVVYIDEVQMVAYDGLTGAERFQTNAHASVTMMEYPIIADVDADDHAEIVVNHNGLGYGISVYEDINDSWAPTRKLWNQHPYSVTNINDDLSVPVEAEPGFSVYNLWHGAASPLDDGIVLLDDLEGEVVDLCADCDAGEVFVLARVINRSADEMAAGIPVALYGRWSDGDRLVATAETPDPIASGWTGEAIEFVVSADDLAGAESVWFVVDDDGTGVGIIEECSESNNGFLREDDLCD
jgi:hypothetical protein